MSRKYAVTREQEEPTIVFYLVSIILLSIEPIDGRMNSYQQH